MRRNLLVIGLLFLLTACSVPRQATQGFSLDDEIAVESFDEAFRWETRTQGAVAIGVEDGVYRMRSDVSSYVRGFSSYSGANVVIDVETLPLSNHDNNAFGIVCRASFDADSANGYYFLVGADGSYSIRRGRQGEVEGLVKWATHDAINRGSRINRVRAVCIEDYLALYVNGTFITEVRDDTYRDGVVGFAVATESGSQIDVTFDNLTIYTARLLD